MVSLLEGSARETALVLIGAVRLGLLVHTCIPKFRPIEPVVSEVSNRGVHVA